MAVQQVSGLFAQKVEILGSKKMFLPSSSSIKCNSSWVREISFNAQKKRGRGKGSVKANVILSHEITSTTGLGLELLDAVDDQYGGLHIQPNSLPVTADAFATALRTSLSFWKLKGKRGVWLKLLSDQAGFVPIAIQEGFKYHHAEAEYIILTHWIPDEPCLLPASPSHLIGVAAFVMNETRQVLVVKEKYPCSCHGVWKLPTGYVEKGEDLFCGAAREVKEETGVDTIFQEIVAFRHAHCVAFEKSDLLFVCTLKPLSSEITIDDKEVEGAQWMDIEELVGQAFYEEDQMTRKIVEICVEAKQQQQQHGNSTSSSNGFISLQLISKLDGRLPFLYFRRNAFQ